MIKETTAAKIVKRTIIVWFLIVLTIVAIYTAALKSMILLIQCAVSGNYSLLKKSLYDDYNFLRTVYKSAMGVWN